MHQIRIQKPKVNEGSRDSPVRLPLACGSDGTGALGLLPQLRIPPLPATHVRVGTGLKHTPRTTFLTSVDPPFRESIHTVRPRFVTRS